MLEIHCIAIIQSSLSNLQYKSFSHCSKTLRRLVLAIYPDRNLYETKWLEYNILLNSYSSIFTQKFPHLERILMCHCEIILYQNYDLNMCRFNNFQRHLSATSLQSTAFLFINVHHISLENSSFL